VGGSLDKGKLERKYTVGNLFIRRKKGSDSRVEGRNSILCWKRAEGLLIVV